MSKIIDFPKQLELPLKWWDVDWNHGGVITDISRPTEDTALENVATQARMLHAVGEPVFSDEQWIVYIADLRLRFKHKNMNCVSEPLMSKLISDETRIGIASVEAALNRIDTIMNLRDMLGMSILPPIPFEFAGKMKAVRKVQAAA